MSKLPAFQFYPGDWLKDPNLRRCSVGARGVYMDVLCVMFEHEPRGILARFATQPPFIELQFMLDSCNSLNGEDSGKLQGIIDIWTQSDLARTVTGVDTRTASKYIGELIKNNVIKQLNDGTMYSKRLVSDEIYRMKKAEAGKSGGQKSSSKQQANRQANKGSSSSSSSSIKKTYTLTDENKAKLKQNYPKRAGSNPWNDAFTKIEGHVKEAMKNKKGQERKDIAEATLNDMFSGMKRYYIFCENEDSIGTKYIMQAKKFFGRDKHFIEDWAPARKRAQDIKIIFPPRGDCNKWIAFAQKHGLGTKPGETQFDFERRIRNLVTDKLNK